MHPSISELTFFDQELSIIIVGSFNCDCNIRNELQAIIITNSFWKVTQGYGWINDW